MANPLDLTATLDRLRAQEERPHTLADALRELHAVLKTMGLPEPTPEPIPETLRAKAVNEFRKLQSTFHDDKTNTQDQQ